jgi:archaellum component FlaC
MRFFIEKKQIKLMDFKQTVFLLVSIILISNIAASIGPKCPGVAPEIIQADYDGNDEEIKLSTRSDTEATYKLIFYDSGHNVQEMKTFEKSSSLHEENFDLSNAPAKISMIPENGCSFTATSTTDIRYKGVYEEPKLKYGENSNSDDKVNDLEDKLEEKNDKIEDLESQLNDKKDNLENGSERIETLEKAVLRLNNTLEQKNDKINELDSSLETKEQRISELENQINNSESKDSSNKDTNQRKQERSDKERKGLVNNIISSIF